MAIRSESTVINGSKYTVTTLQAWDALEAALDVAKLIAPAFEGQDPRSVQVSTLFEQDNDQLLASLARIVSAADKAVLRRVLEAMARCTQIQSKDGTHAILEQVFDLHFAGSPDEMLKWAAFALQVNYGNFFDASTRDDVVKFEAAIANRETSRA